VTVCSQPYLGLLVPTTFFPQFPIPIFLVSFIFISFSLFYSCYYPSSLASIVSHLLLCLHISSCFGTFPLQNTRFKNQRFLLVHSSSCLFFPHIALHFSLKTKARDSSEALVSVCHYMTSHPRIKLSSNTAVGTRNLTWINDFAPPARTLIHNQFKTQLDIIRHS
jgi:hypothetical protein